MQVSIITINYNSSSFTIKLVESIFKNVSKLIDYEIIITDNSSKISDYENLVKMLPKDEKIKLLEYFHRDLSSVKDWSIQEITHLFEKFTNDQNIKLIDIAKPLRVALTGRIVPTGIYELIYALGKEDTLTRISQHLYK